MAGFPSCATQPCIDTDLFYLLRFLSWNLSWFSWCAFHPRFITDNGPELKNEKDVCVNIDITSREISLIFIE